MLRWSVRQPRVWLAVAAFGAATWLAAGDGRPAWTRFVAVSTFALAALAIRERYDTDHPDLTERRAEREQARQQEQVAEILWRYERERARRARDAE